MPGCGNYAGDIKRHHPGVLKYMLHLGEGLERMRAEHRAAEAQMIGVLNDVSEGYDACPALREVQPVALPRVFADVRVATPPDVDAVEAVVKDRDPYETQLHEKHAGQAVEELNLLAVGDGPFEGFGVGDEMFEKESPDGNDAGERVQAAQEERVTFASPQRRNSRPDAGSGR